MKVAVICGGKSAEHEVSLLSARNILKAIDPKHEKLLIGIDRNGAWFLVEEEHLLKSSGLREIQANGRSVGFVKRGVHAELWDFKSNKSLGGIDVAFPVLHGPMGEDGTIQGLFKLMGIPYVGPDVLGSALGMDKEVMKRLLKEAGVPIAKYIYVRRHQSLSPAAVEKYLGLPVFVKPANLGSSVGVSKAATLQELEKAVQHAFEFDHKVLIEECIIGREIECAVLGNENPKASVLGEIIPQAEFYSYDAKYVDSDGAKFRIPAMISSELTRLAQEMALKTFVTLNCEGMARVDFFLRGDKELLINEINTIPGFTQISMYPKMWEASGLSATELVAELLRLAMARFERDQKLKNSR